MPGEIEQVNVICLEQRAQLSLQSGLDDMLQTASLLVAEARRITQLYLHTVLRAYSNKFITLSFHYVLLRI